MPRLSDIPAMYLSLHPIMDALHELTLSPNNPVQEEHCRFHEDSSNRFIHLYPNGDTNSIVMRISSNEPKDPVWELHIYMDLWTRTDLQRTIDGIDPLFEFHPLGWASEAHKALLERWGSEHGVQIAAVQGFSRRLYIW